MARIRETVGRSDGDSGYARLFGDEALGALISRVHATAIRNGNELEDLLRASCPIRAAGLEERLNQPSLGLSRRLEAYFRESLPAEDGSRPTQVDVVVLDNVQRSALVVEVKDGDSFDTKKADGELESILRVVRLLESGLRYECDHAFCCFNQSDKDVMLRGTKMRFDRSNLMTGPELCELLQLDYDALRLHRHFDAEDNLDYFLQELAEIPRVRARLERSAQQRWSGRLFDDPS